MPVTYQQQQLENAIAKLHRAVHVVKRAAESAGDEGLADDMTQLLVYVMHLGEAQLTRKRRRPTPPGQVR